MFERLLKKILTNEGKEGKINVALVDDQEIRELNKRFRHQDRATDVLSFTMNEDGVLGDIAISTEAARRQARRYGWSYRRELKRLVVHGTLHVLGYDHSRRMSHAEKIYQKS
jgi:probable rRNA maturation factor